MMLPPLTIWVQFGVVQCGIVQVASPWGNVSPSPVGVVAWCGGVLIEQASEANACLYV